MTEDQSSEIVKVGTLTFTKTLVCVCVYQATLQHLSEDINHHSHHQTSYVMTVYSGLYSKWPHI